MSFFKRVGRSSPSKKWEVIRAPKMLVKLKKYYICRSRSPRQLQSHLVSLQKPILFNVNLCPGLLFSLLASNRSTLNSTTACSTTVATVATVPRFSLQFDSHRFGVHLLPTTLDHRVEYFIFR